MTPATAMATAFESVEAPFLPIESQSVGIMGAWPSAPWVERFLAHLRELATLELGWDSYNGQPLNRQTIERAATLIYRLGLDFGATAPTHMGPTPEGGIQLEWEGDDVALEIEIRPNGLLEILVTGTEFEPLEKILGEEVGPEAVGALVDFVVSG